MKFRILPLAASLVLALRFLNAEPVPAPVAEPPKAAPVVEPAKPAEPAPAATPVAPAEQAKPAEPKKPAELPPPKPLGNEVGKGLAWLAKSQNSDGGWGQGGGWRINRQQGQGGRVEGDQIPDPSDIGNTAIALQAFLRAGTKLDSGEHSQVAAKAAEFLLTRLEADKEDSLYVTTVRDTQLQSKIGAYVDTFLAAQILADLKDRLPRVDDEQRRVKLLDKVVAKIQKHQKEDGAFAGNNGWASTLSQGICSKALNGAWAAGAKVDLAALEKDHKQNTDGLDRASGVVASGAVADAGVEIYRYSAKLGGMTGFAMNNITRRNELEKTVAAPTASEPEKVKAKEELAKIDKSDADQQVLLRQVAGRAQEQGFVGGFGNHGGEEFISYMNIGEALRVAGGEEWTKWDVSMTKTLHDAQNADGSWAGQHCITGRTFCTASALMVLMTDRAPVSVVAKNDGTKP